MPKVVLGADAETTLKIQKMLLRGRTDKTTAEDKTLEQEISGLSLQTTREQLAFFAYYCLRKHNLTPKLSDEELVKLNHQKIKEITKTPQARELLQSNQQFSRIIWRHLDVLRFIEQAQQKNPQKLSGKITIPSYLRLISSQENWEK